MLPSHLQKIDLTADELTNVSLSDNGRFILFESSRSDLLPSGQDTNGVDDVFLFDLQTNEIERVSIGAGGLEITTGGFQADISADGRFVVFLSGSGTYLRDRLQYHTETVDVEVWAPLIFADGTSVAGLAYALYSDGTSGNQILKHDLSTDETVAWVTSRDLGVSILVPPGVVRKAPAISGSGNCVVFIGRDPGQTPYAFDDRYYLFKNFDPITDDTILNFEVSDSGVVVYQNWDHEIHVYDIDESDRILATGAELLDFSANGRFVALLKDGLVVYDLLHGTEITLDEDFYGGSAQLSGDGEFIVITTIGNTIYAGSVRGGIFSDGDDTVDFNALTSNQQALLGAQANLYLSLDGNDTVTLPNTLRINSSVSWDPSKVFDAGAGNDTVNGGNRDDKINGGGGNDVINGGARNDTIKGDAAGDILYGGKGIDQLRGGSHNDTIYAGDANVLFVTADDSANTLFGEDGSDTLTAWTRQSEKSDVLDGGAGQDTYYVDGRDKIVRFEPGEHAFVLSGNTLDKAIVYSVPGRTTISFFTNNLGGVVSRIEFGNQISPNDFTIQFDSVLGPQAAKISYTPDIGAKLDALAQSFVKTFQEYICLVKPMFDFAIAAPLFDKASKAALKKGADAIKAKLTDLVLAKTGDLTSAIVANAFTDIAEKLLKTFLEKAIKGKELSCNVVQTDFAEYATDVLTALHPVAGKWTKLGSAFLQFGFEALFQSMNKDFEQVMERAPDTREFIRPKSGVQPTDTIVQTDTANIISVISQGKLQTVVPVANKTNYLFSNLDVDRAPNGIQNLYLNEVTSGSTPQRLFGNALNNELVGNNAANVIDGGAGNDIINGALGNDRMSGRAGNDTYYVGAIGDQVIEAVNQGTDTIHSKLANYTLPNHVENLILDPGAKSGSGNSQHNVITGNGVSNVLSGALGNDILDGAAAADTMTGGGGNDTYIVNHPGDKAMELANGGIDTLRASIAKALPNNVENLVLLGNAHIFGVGNALPNQLTGNSGNNILNGAAGNDILNGLGGKDTLIGGLGKDFFAFNTALNVATNVDRIVDFAVIDDTMRLENGVFTALGTTVGTLSANKFFKGAAAHDADDRIIYNSATGALIYDANGSAAGGTVQFATVAKNLLLTNADFQVI